MDTLIVDFVQKPCAFVIHIVDTGETLKRLATFFQDRKILVESLQFHRYRDGDGMVIAHCRLEKLTEHHLYGSSRLGIWNKDLDMDNAPTGVDNEDLVGATMLHTFRRGQKFFELSNHLGNVLVTISDRKALQTWDDGTANGGCAPGTGVEELSVDTRGTATSFVGRTTVNVLAGFESGEEDNFEIYTDEELDACVPVEGGGSSEASVYTAEIVSANDYYPFGMLMPGRSYAVDGEYRYGFNGKENDNEVKGHGVQQDYGMRIYDTRLGKFLSVDPLTKGYPFLTPYQFASNIPTAAIDIDGEESGLPLNGIGASGKPLSEYFLTAEGRKSWAKAMGTGLGVGGAVMLDIFVTKGYITKTLLASQGLGLFEHNIGKTPEQRKAQLERFRENSLDFLKNVAGGYVINKLALGIIALGSESRKLYNFGMKALGEMGEESLALQYGTIKPSGKGSSMSTSLGPRKPAGIPVGTTVKSTDKLYESKVGFQNYEGDVIKQVLKDKELLATGQVQEITWVFYRSPNTGKVGASEELLKELGVGGIKTEIAGDIPKNILQKAIEKYAPTTKN